LIDIREHPSIIEAINEIVNENGAAEVKIEHGSNHHQLTVVSIKRKLRIRDGLRENE